MYKIDKDFQGAIIGNPNDNILTDEIKNKFINTDYFTLCSNLFGLGENKNIIDFDDDSLYSNPWLYKFGKKQKYIKRIKNRQKLYNKLRKLGRRL